MRKNLPNQHSKQGKFQLRFANPKVPKQTQLQIRKVTPKRNQSAS